MWQPSNEEEDAKCMPSLGVVAVKATWKPMHPSESAAFSSSSTFFFVSIPPFTSLSSYLLHSLPPLFFFMLVQFVFLPAEMADWGPVVIAVVLFVLLTPGLLFQLPQYPIKVFPTSSWPQNHVPCPLLQLFMFQSMPRHIKISMQERLQERKWSDSDVISWT